MIHYLSSAKPPAASLLERHEAGRLLRVGEWVEAGGGGLVLTPGPWHRSREPQVNIEVEVLVCGGRVAGVQVLGVPGVAAGLHHVSVAQALVGGGAVVVARYLCIAGVGGAQPAQVLVVVVAGVVSSGLQQPPLPARVVSCSLQVCVSLHPVVVRGRGGGCLLPLDDAVLVLAAGEGEGGLLVLVAVVVLGRGRGLHYRGDRGARGQRVAHGGGGVVGPGPQPLNRGNKGYTRVQNRDDYE